MGSRSTGRCTWCASGWVLRLRTRQRMLRLLEERWPPAVEGNGYDDGGLKNGNKYDNRSFTPRARSVFSRRLGDRHRSERCARDGGVRRADSAGKQVYFEQDGLA